MPLFGGLTESSLNYLMDRSRIECFEPGDWLFQETDSSDCMYVLEKGMVSIYKEFEGKSYELNKLGVGDCVGEMSLLDLRPRSASVKVLTSCRAIYISAALLHKFHRHDLSQFTMLNLNMAREVVRRLRTADHELFRLRLQLNLPPEDIGMA